MIKAIKNRILLKKDEQPDKIGLIYVPKLEGQHAPPYSGIILSVGPDIEDPDYEEGLRVIFHDLAGTEFEVNGEKIFSIRDTDVTAIILDKISKPTETK
jgi:co-chaperonin GroES (HSP10)